MIIATEVNQSKLTLF